MIRKILAAASAALFLAGCTADLQRAKDLSVGDGLQYVEDNHAFRQQIRAEYQQIVLTQAKRCVVEASQSEDSIDESEKCIDWLMKHYPELATFALIREGAESVNTLVPALRAIGQEE